jgi:hypothetical protein
MENRTVARPRRSGGFHALMELRPTSAHRNGVSRPPWHRTAIFRGGRHGKMHPEAFSARFPGMGNSGTQSSKPDGTFPDWNSDRWAGAARPSAT